MSTIGFITEGEADATEEAAAESLFLSDGECHINDSAEFYEATGGIAAQFRDGVLFVLRRDTLRWVNVESIPKPTAAKLATIKGAR